MDVVYLVLRLLHILSAVFWIGSAMMMVVFVEPAVRLAGEPGGAVMQNILKRGLPIAGNVAAAVAVVAGLLLYGRDFGGSGAAGPGGNPTVLAFSLGGFAAILALVLSWAVAAPTGRGLGKLAATMRSHGQPPTPEQLDRLSGLQRRVRVVSRVILALLTGTLALMAVARAL